MKNALVSKLAEPPKGVNIHLLSPRLPLSNGKKFATLVSPYAATMPNPDDIKDKFYEDPKNVIGAIVNLDKLIIFGDMQE